MYVLIWLMLDFCMKYIFFTILRMVGIFNHSLLLLPHIISCWSCCFFCILWWTRRDIHIQDLGIFNIKSETYSLLEPIKMQHTVSSVVFQSEAYACGRTKFFGVVWGVAKFFQGAKGGGAQIFLRGQRDRAPPSRSPLCPTEKIWSPLEPSKKNSGPPPQTDGPPPGKKW